MKFEIIIRTAGLSEEEIADLRQRAGRRAAKLRAEHPDAEIFLVEDDSDASPSIKRLEVREVEK